MNPQLPLNHSGARPSTVLLYTLMCLLIFGVLYMVLTTLLGQVLFSTQAKGSLLKQGGRVLGSSLVGQNFTSERYFYGRPSAAGKGYDPTSASGRNLAVSNPALRERVGALSVQIAAKEGVAPTDIPADLLSASGSGLDPHISPAAAKLQAARVAKARGLALSLVQQKIDKHTELPLFGVFGQARVNVLHLNVSLGQ
jgi:potassium-transporting ATPase KdpC subunit